jgi:predicted nucleic acid-binding protein
LKIIVDTNIVFSAILNSNSRIGKLLTMRNDYVQLYSCNYLQYEIVKHRNKLLQITKLIVEDLEEVERTVTRNILFIDERLLPKMLLIATEKLISHIDPNDTPFVALTKHLKGKLWTGDRQLYNGLKEISFSDVLDTAELCLLLDDLERE